MDDAPGRHRLKWRLADLENIVALDHFNRRLKETDDHAASCALVSEEVQRRLQYMDPWLL